MKGSIQIRTYNLSELLKEIWDFEKKKFLPRFTYLKKDRTLNWFYSCIDAGYYSEQPDHDLAVLWKDGLIIGIGQLVFNKIFPMYSMTQKVIILSYLSIHKDYRGLGYGKKLAEYMFYWVSLKKLPLITSEYSKGELIKDTFNRLAEKYNLIFIDRDKKGGFIVRRFC